MLSKHPLANGRPDDIYDLAAPAQELAQKQARRNPRCAAA